MITVQIEKTEGSPAARSAEATTSKSQDAAKTCCCESAAAEADGNFD